MRALGNLRLSPEAKETSISDYPVTHCRQRYILRRIALSLPGDLTVPDLYCMIVLSFSSFLFSSALATLSEAALGFFKAAKTYGQSLKALNSGEHHWMTPPKAPSTQSNTAQ